MDKDQKKVARRQISILHCYKKVFGSEAGKRVLLDICNDANLLGSTYRTEGRDSECFVREGERNLALKILTKVKYDLKKLIEELDREEAEDDGYFNDYGKSRSSK